MAGVRISIYDTETNGSLSGLTAALDDLRPMLKNIGEHVQATTIERFGRQVSPAGVPWAPLNAEYAAGKKGPGILRETGRLAEIVYQVAAQTLLVGSNAIYAAIHQFGGIIRPKSAAALVFSLGGKTIFAKSVTMPKREFLGLTEEDQTEIRLIAEDFLDVASGRAISTE